MNIEINVPDGKIGDWSVESFTVKKDELTQVFSMMKTGRGVPSGNYKRLMRNGSCIMSNTPDEIRDFMSFVRIAKGDILINGLGLGVLVQALLNKKEVTSITIIENSIDVIELVANTYLKDKRVDIISADAFKWSPLKGVRYNAVWHDIWDNITADNLPEMHKLHRKYGRKSDYQDSWCRAECERHKKQENSRYW